MQNFCLCYYNLRMLINIAVGITGVLLFLYVFWKRLKDDYSSDIIFQSSTVILLGSVLGLGIAKLFFSQYFFWLSILGILAGFVLMVFKFKLRLFETLEALILATLPLAALMFFKDSIVKSSLYSFLAFVGVLVLIFTSYWLDVNYKSFTWYKSGRIGFAGLLVGIIFFLIRTVIACFGVAVISFVGQLEIFLSGALTLSLIGLLIYLGRSK